MIRVTEKYYIRKINKIGKTYFGTQQRKRTTYWLLFIIPILVTDRLIDGHYEN